MEELRRLKRAIRVLVVDDSAFMRKVITETLDADKMIKVVGIARNGRSAIDKVKILKPDVVTLDYMMPEKDGLETLEDLIRDYRQPVVMVSSFTTRGADITMRALALGAVDFVLKPFKRDAKVFEDFQFELVGKVKVASVSRPTVNIDVSKPLTAGPKRAVAGKFGKVVVIACSTGGPQALLSVVPRLSADANASYLIVQHMPPKFTLSLAKRLNDQSQIGVSEARDGDKLSRGHALLAPGDFHMTVDPDGIIDLEQTPPIGGLRPRADITMEAAARSFGGDVLAVVLTGMGADGTEGAKAIKANKGYCVVQDEASCVVYGMPKSVVRHGCADKILPLDQISQEIMHLSGVRH